MGEATLELLACALTYFGYALLALRQRPHWRAVGRRGPRAVPAPALRARLLVAGSGCLSLALSASCFAEGPSFGSLLWVFMLACSGVAVTFTLTWKPHWLGCLLRAGPARSESAGTETEYQL